jgi:hypothetical protein
MAQSVFEYFLVTRQKVLSYDLTGPLSSGLCGGNFFGSNLTGDFSVDAALVIVYTGIFGFFSSMVAEVFADYFLIN